MKVIQVGVFATTLAWLSTYAYGYSFSDVAKEDTTKVEKTGLTTNEESYIYGGSEANIDKYPYLASLQYSFFGLNLCGGTLIAPQYILTAGHCIMNDGLPMIASFGSNESMSSGGVTVPIAEGFRHPLYKKKGHRYDVGLYKLEKPVKRKTAKLCAADGSDNKVGTMGTAVGWGKTETSGILGSPVLKEVTLPVISNAECGKFKKYVGRVTEGMLCAGTGNGQDTCKGDSGGPLLVDDDIIIGCVSWGSKCGEQPGIFTRLTYVMDYIEDILAGGDGSKFNVTSSSYGSSEDSSSDATKTPVKESSESEDTEASRAETTKIPVVEEDSQSGSDDLSQVSASGSESASGSGGIPSWMLEFFEGSGNLSWLFDSTSNSGSASDIDSESNSASEESGSEDTALVKGKNIKATKAPVEEQSEDSPYQQTSVEDESASTSGSKSASESGDVAHQSSPVHQSKQVINKQK
ncbi:Serine protease [Phytophthora cinnamomi]|uniref:Serine protease n=1 Tax=Phytophthora cinnamomi TaxID=4785 RepID=UPI00355A0517|nr:Serine protease [Phytophthora cinnamomi]